MTKFDGKTCLITGAASGLGRATAFAAAAKGAALVLTDITADALDATATELRAAGATVHLAHAADVSDHSAVVGLAAHTFEAVSHVDIVMNVAGIATWGTVDKLSHQQWRRTVDINLMGPIHVIEEFLPPMIAAGRGGHLVNVSSAAGLFGLPWHAPYSATKFGLRGVSEVLRFDLRRHKIGVSLVCPGAMATPMVDSVDIAGVDRDNAALQKAMGLFLRHAVTPEQAAAAVVKGVERNRYWVYTSRDIQLAHWGQRYVPYGYTLAMRGLNSVMTNYATKNELVR
ncbi:short chain dehydrogenase [Nocardia neocaledoniensis NBRC 108232]|uniref:Short-subunit dehydrogenase n=1 Tax=Nocardia neocaledoniensis TaxID=236511 RepID=A0A317N5N2_9NOCA|nr:SDR family oxidoreductase [Nocardia neocaledoniensis]PWV70384.1 short-subunit dehydrogenase [Nocardia neocaledoniensis]GEM35350.1 short chain dehydrogenase [Nocardia neocaledoniensis NBRC 108232]